MPSIESPRLENHGFERYLEAIVSDPARERDWLDMLSQLEYVGCRKILKAVPYEGVSLEVLQHAAEEASHAYLMKKVAAALGAKMTWQANPFSQLGWRYFQSLDRAVSAISGITESPYPAVSWIVEQRVLAIYPLYLEKTSDPAVKRVLTTILAQERRHAGQFDAINYPEDIRRRMLAIESRLWQELSEEVEAMLFGGIDLALSLEASSELTELRATD